MLEIRGSCFEGGGSLCALGRVAPHDGSAGLGRYDGIDGFFHDEDPVRDRESQSSTGTAFACDGGDGGNAEPGHFAQVASDGFCLSALFGAEAGVCSHEIDESEDGAVEFFRQLHAAQRFAITLTVGHSKFAMDFLFGTAALEIADDHDLFAVESCEG